MYLRMIDRITEEHLDANVSVKLTQMGQDIDTGFLRENVGRIVDRARDVNMFVRLDMESSQHTRPTLDFFRSLWEEGYRNIGIVLQAYMRRSEADVRMANEIGAHVRLCKGAYREPSTVAFRRKRQVDAAFDGCLRALMSSQQVRPAVATHDSGRIDLARRLAVLRTAPFEFQLLYGVRTPLQQELVAGGFPLRVYVPYGAAWYPYLTRRLAERPANLRFFARALAGRRARDGEPA
jgi:proline dehydrogenase